MPAHYLTLQHEVYVGHCFWFIEDHDHENVHSVYSVDMPTRELHGRLLGA